MTTTLDHSDGRPFPDPANVLDSLANLLAYHRCRSLFCGPWKTGELVAFHSREKMLLLARDPLVYREMGRLVATAKKRDPNEVAVEYETLFTTALRRSTSRGSHTNVLEHMAGHLKHCIATWERRALHGVIGRYRSGQIPLAVPLQLLRRHVDRHRIEYLAAQTYLIAGLRP